MVRYRSLRPSDVGAVRAVALRSWHYAYRDVYKPATIDRRVADYYSAERFRTFDLPAIRDGRAYFCVAIDRGNIVGHAEVGRRGGGWDLFRIYLLPEFMARGTGSELLCRCERFLRRKGARRYTAFIHFKNRAAGPFYLRCGFVRNPAKDHSTSRCFEKRLN